MTNALTLAEIIRRNVTVQWHEAVTLIRAVIEQLSGEDPRVPELFQIELRPTGRVELSGGAACAEPVRRLGQLLQASLGQADPPVQLRLVIAQATAPTPSFHSIGELDEALRYYERPDREAVLQALYERAAATVVVEATAATSPTLDEIAPLPKPERSKPARPPKSPQEKRRQRQLAIAAVFVLLISGGAAYYAKVSGVAESAEVIAIAAKAKDVVGTAVVSSLSAVTETVGLGRLVTGASGNEAPPAPAPVDIPNVSTPGPPRAAAPAPLAVETMPLVVFDLDAKAESAVSPSTKEEAAVAPSTESTAANGTDEPGIYTPAHQGILPPVGIRPQLPRELPANVRREDLARIDLVVAADGTVETVKLVSSPRDVHDSMWLSAIKAWQFQPALKDGQPVRYLKTVWIAPR